MTERPLPIQQLINLAKEIDDQAVELETSIKQGIEEPVFKDNPMRGFTLEARLWEFAMASAALLVAAGEMEKSAVLGLPQKDFVDVMNGKYAYTDIREERRAYLRAQFPWNKQPQEPKEDWTGFTDKRPDDVEGGHGIY